MCVCGSVYIRQKERKRERKIVRVRVNERAGPKRVRRAKKASDCKKSRKENTLKFLQVFLREKNSIAVSQEIVFVVISRVLFRNRQVFAIRGKL